MKAGGLMKKMILMLLILLNSNNVFAQNKIEEGSGFLKICENQVESEYIKGACVGFLKGLYFGRAAGYFIATDNLLNSQAAEIEKNRLKETSKQGKSNLAVPYCIDDIKFSQQVLILIKYLKDNPQLLHLSTWDLIPLALQEPFPCKKKSPQEIVLQLEKLKLRLNSK